MESELGVTFPPLYKAKLVAENGGELDAADDDWQLYPVFDQSDKKRIARTCNSIAHETKNDRQRHGFPVDAVSIGSNGSGDQLILLPQQPGVAILSDVIYWWNHETREVGKIAESIADLV